MGAAEAGPGRTDHDDSWMPQACVLEKLQMVQEGPMQASPCQTRLSVSLFKLRITEEVPGALCSVLPDKYVNVLLLVTSSHNKNPALQKAPSQQCQHNATAF